MLTILGLSINVRSLLACAAVYLFFYVVFSLTALAKKDAAIRKLGGHRAQVLWRNPILGFYHTTNLIRKSAQFKIVDVYDTAFGKLRPESRNIFEIGTPLSSRVVETREPSHVKAVLAEDFHSFGKGEMFHRIWSPWLGDGIFTTDGELWSKSRKLIRPMFATDRMSDLYIFERQVEKMMTHIPPSGQSVDMKDLFFRMTLDVTTDFLLGESSNSLDNPKGEFTHAFNDILSKQMYIMVLRNLWPLDRFFMPAYHRHIKTIDDFINPYIKQALSIPPEELEKITKSDTEFTFLHNLALFTRDPKVIRDQLMAVLLAGRDTTAATLSWAFYELAACPEKVERLRAEVLEHIGVGGTPTYETLKNMKYLRYVLQETLRLHPAVPFNIRVALKDTVLPEAPGSPSISICKGDTLCYSPFNIQGRRDIYPPVSANFADPSKFSPERWYVWQPRPWEYVPFNGGPRICPGQNFALTEMAYCIVRIFQKYDRMEYGGDWYAQKDKMDVISRPAFAVPISFFEAKN
ncbi:cytochrome P450 [Xylariaceae sp. FL1019]|nr:cytochrome P450 [Xylariaceae sp. FL1019]